MIYYIVMEYNKNRQKNKTDYLLNQIIKEYELKQNNFDPSKKSPNFFIKKLEIRMKKYYRDLYNSNR